MIDFSDINLRAMPHIEQILDSLKIEHKLASKELKFINPLRDDTEFGSASINTETGLWADFAEADDPKAKGGDLISLVAYLTGTNYLLAAKKLQSFLSESAFVAIEPVQQVEAVEVVEAVKTVDTETHIVINGVHYDLVYPVPDGAPFPPRDFGDALGEPSNIYVYRDNQGRLLGYILRFDGFAGKTIRPATLWMNEAGKYEWRLHGFPMPRPLYNLHLLAQRPDAPVLIVEGEKSANAASLLFPEHVVVTTMHGAKSPGQSDLTPLLGRIVSMWADYDGPGQRYEETMVKLLRLQDDKASISIMQLITYSAAYDLDKNPMLEPGFIPSEGWDAADAVAEGWTRDHIKLLPTDFYIKSEPDESEPEELEYMVSNFRVSDAGVESIRLDKDGDSYATWICSKLEVKALSRDMHSSGWGIVLEFKDKDQHMHKWCMPKSMLVDDRGYRSELLRMGLDIAPGDGLQLSSYLQQCNPNQRVLAVSQPGWYKNLYVLPNRIFGGNPESVMVQTSDP